MITKGLVGKGKKKKVISHASIVDWGSLISFYGLRGQVLRAVNHHRALLAFTPVQEWCVVFLCYLLQWIAFKHLSAL